MFDLGGLGGIFSARLKSAYDVEPFHVIQASSPDAGPSPPPPFQPWSPPSQSPHLLHNSPAVPPTAEACVSTEPVDNCGNGLVDYTKDGVCDDGGSGSSWAMCVLNTDMSDCGVRECASGRRLDSTGESERLEFWVSRLPASFGTRAAALSLSGQYGEEVALPLNEGDSTAHGRYVFLRSFQSEHKLRIEGVRFFGKPEVGTDEVICAPRRGGRSSGDEWTVAEELASQEWDAATATLEESIAAEANAELVDTEAATAATEASSEMTVAAMLRLTKRACQATSLANTRQARAEASVLWARLTEDESALACTDCITRVAGSCTFWFAANHRMGTSNTKKDRHTSRNLKEHLEKEKPVRQEAIRSHFDKTCCRTSHRTGKRECGVRFCKEAMKQRALPRMAHILRKLHEGAGSTQLSVAELVSTDVLGPHLHTDKRCRSDSLRRKTGELECIAASLVGHLGKKHGFSTGEVDAKLEAMGLSLSKILAAQLYHSVQPTPPPQTKAGPTVEKTPGPRSEPFTTPVRPAPGAAWLSRSTVSNRRRQQQQVQTERRNIMEVMPTGNLRQVKADAAAWGKNHSIAAKRLMRAASVRIGNVGGSPLTSMGILHSAWEASLASDSSIVSRGRSIFGGVGKISAGLQDMSELLRKAKATGVGPERRRRKISSEQEDTLRQVGDLLRQDRGFQIPAAHLESHGWITEAVDWPFWYQEARRVGDVLYDRQQGHQLHAQTHGTLPVGDLHPSHKTGYWWLDLNAPTSAVGDAIRSLVPLPAGRPGAEHIRDLHRLPRQKSSVAQTGVLSALADAVVSKRDPFDAMFDALQRNEHRSTTRRLSDLGAYFGERTVKNTAYFASRVFGSATYTVPSTNEDDDTGWGPIRQIGRYIVYDTLLCYLYAPPVSKGGAFGDGTNLGIHFGNRACFPMIPFVPGDMPTFNAYFGLQSDFQWSTLEYGNACDSASVKALIIPLSSKSFLYAPYGSILKMAEGIDSIRNLARSHNGSSSENERASAVICGIAQLGGVIWTALVLIVLGLLCVIAPLGSCACLQCLRCVRSRRLRLNEESLNNVLAATVELVVAKLEEGDQPVPAQSAPAQSFRRFLRTSVVRNELNGVSRSVDEKEPLVPSKL